MKRLLLSLFALYLLTGPTGAADRYQRLKRSLSKADCLTLEFLSILESDIFNTTDTARGRAAIARDGRFHVWLDGDEYLYDNDLLYSYSARNAQVSIERPASREEFVRGVTFITHLDEYYKSDILRPGEAYHLTKKENVYGNLPDSLDVFLLPDTLALDRIDYYDINDELNRLVIVRQRTTTHCLDSVFLPVFPDSAERVRLY